MKKTNSFFKSLFTGVCLTLFMAGTLSAQTSSSTWQSFSVSTETDEFTATFDATPNGNNIDALTGIQNGTASAYSDLACIIRFNSSGNIDARNGGSYTASNTISYSSGTLYHFRVEIDVPGHTYSVYVTPDGGSEQTVASNFAFRTEQSGVSQLTGYALYAYIGSHTVSNVAFSSGEEPSNLALGKSVTVDSEYNATYLAENAVDGNNTDNVNRWLSANSSYPHWIEIDLGSTSTITQVNFWTGYNGYGYAIEDYQVQYWTGSSWADIVNISGNSNAIVTHSFSATETDRVRLYATDGVVDNILRLYEIEVIGTSGGVGGGDTQAPSVPNGLSSSSVGQTSFTLSWNASTDNVGVTAYEVFKDGGSIGTTSGTSMSVTGLSASTTYSMRVRARDVAGNWSSQSSALNVTTAAGSDTQAPSVPNGLSSSSVGQASFTLSWNASTDNVGVTAYEVFKDGGSIGTTSSTSMSVNGLSASTTYSMRVRARDAAGNWSAQSSALNVTTASGGGSGDFPTPATTGPSGTLTNYTGNITANTNGQIIENMNISGRIYIKANNVTIRNCKFGQLDISTSDPYTGCVVEDCELLWAGRQNFTLRRCYMTQQSTDLIRTGGPNVTVEDCYLLITAPIINNAHADIIQEYPTYSGANMVCRHNTMYNEISSTSCINISQGWTIDNNLMAGGSYSIYAWNATITDNHFSTIFFPKGGYNGIYYNGGQGSVCSGNVWHETGVPVNCGSSSAAEYVFTAKEEQSVKLYPNPLSGNTLYIQLNGYEESMVNVEIFDLTGRSVLNKLYAMEQDELRLPVGDLKKGIYIVNVNGNELNMQEKLIVD